MSLVKSNESLTSESPAHSTVNVVVLGKPPVTSQVTVIMRSSFVLNMPVSLKASPFIVRTGKSGGGSEIVTSYCQ